MRVLMIGAGGVGSVVAHKLAQVPEVFTGVTAVVNTASEQLLAGTYAPRQGRERVLAQLRQLDPLLENDGEGA